MRYVRIAVCVLFALSVAFFGYVKYNESKQVDNTMPRISGPEDSLEISCSYTEADLLQGLSAYDEKDGDLTAEIMIDSIVPSLEKGKCTVNYVVFDSSNHPATFARNVVFTDYRSPKIYVSKPLVFTANTNENIFGYIGAVDMIDGDITANLRMNTNTNMLEMGDYVINVEVTNSLGDFSTIELPVHIVDNNNSRIDIKLSESMIYIKSGDSFNPEDYIESVTNTDGTQYEKNIVNVESNVNTSKSGVYEVIYTAEESETVKGFTSLLVVVE
ncbi:MAG: DUF5011 domain-containing protein [Clostridia bacterium]|nr:DUF5011 domain-containing protein [Clostridia bacterium]